MENENGRSYYGIHIDVEQLRKEAQQAREEIVGVGEQAAVEIEKIRTLLSQPLPTIDIDVIGDKDGIIEIETAIEEVSRVAGELEERIGSLKDADAALGEVLGDTTGMSEEQRDSLEDLKENVRENIKECEEYSERCSSAAKELKGMTGGTEAQTTATKNLTATQKLWNGAIAASRVALNALKATLMSLGIGLVTAAVSSLIGWLVKLADSTSEAARQAEESRKINEKGSEAYIKASVQIQDCQRRLESFNGTKKEEEKLVKELNGRYGSALGYYKSVSEWKEALVKNGSNYCETLMMEAKAQAVLNKYTEAYVNLENVRARIKAGEYDPSWSNLFGWIGKSAKAAEAEAQAEVDRWKDEYEGLQNDITAFKEKHQLDFHADPSSGKKSGKTWDWKAAAAREKKAIEAYREAVSEYIRDANGKISEMTISEQEDGLAKEINSINEGTRKKLEALERQIEQLAKVRREAAKQQYLASNRNSKEEDWNQTADGKKSTKDWVETLKEESPNVLAVFDEMSRRIVSGGEKAISDVRKKYEDALIDEFGTAEQKMEKLTRTWMEKLKNIPPEFLDEATDKMNKELANLSSQDFKMQIDWEGVFGDLSKQALPSLKNTLLQVGRYFEQNREEMSVSDIKDFQEAIAKLENEIADRNPFAALHKSLKDIGKSKDEYSTALTEWRQKNDELTAAMKERWDAQHELNEINDRIESGELVRDCDEQNKAYERLNKALERLSKAKKEEVQATSRLSQAQNMVTNSYKAFAANVTRVNGVIQSLGGQAANLAGVFSDDVAGSFEKVLSFTDDILDATSSVIEAIGDTGKDVAKGVDKAVEATSQGAKASAQTASTAISTVEKASVILAVISAALQVATAIANLFNTDDKKQREIEKLQERIDQLQWELDNKEAVRLQESVGNAVNRLRDAYAQTTREVLSLHNVSQRYGQAWGDKLGRMIYQSEIYRKTVEKIADAYAAVSYTADKALGEKRYKDSRKDLENLAQQQLLIQQQIDKENSKKKTDKSKIQEWEKQIQELAEEMATVINELLEDIIGRTAEDLASELGNAFFEAARAGEDAMEAWHLKVNDIVSDIIQRMLVTQYLEPEIGKIFDKYKKQWFGNDGTFRGISAVIASADQMADDINSVGEVFSNIYGGLSESLEKYFPVLEDAASRDASRKGIATASQETVDELNGRATAIQGHTYSIAENTKMLLSVTNQILRSVLNIDRNTDGLADSVRELRAEVRSVKNTVDDISVKGIKIR